MLIDDVKIKVRAGRGGDGAVAFNHSKAAVGPTGASGGRGGSIYFEGVSDLGALGQFRFRKELVAENGGRGKRQLNDGANGKDLVLKVPVGTVIHNLSTAKDDEIVSVGQSLLAAKGGRGGKGNFKFRSSVNTSPMEFQEGLPGEQFNIRLELKMIADVGLIGLPNVGKSSLLNELTKAKSKVANYHFTTLEPHLGSYYGLILADIPGLIEGASEGKGLGVKFLRHIERTRVLFHLVSAESEDPVKDYKSIRNELGAYNKALLEKDEYLFLSKTDLLDAKIIKGKLAKLKKLNKKAVVLSIHDVNAIDLVQKILNKIAQEKEI